MNRKINKYWLVEKARVLQKIVPFSCCNAYFFFFLREHSSPDLTSFSSKYERLVTRPSSISLISTRTALRNWLEQPPLTFSIFCPQTFPLKTKKTEMRLKKTASWAPSRTRTDSASTGRATATAMATTTTADTHPRSPARSRAARKNYSMKVSFCCSERGSLH